MEEMNNRREIPAELLEKIAGGASDKTVVIAQFRCPFCNQDHRFRYIVDTYGGVSLLNTLVSYESHCNNIWSYGKIVTNSGQFIEAKTSEGVKGFEFDIIGAEYGGRTVWL